AGFTGGLVHTPKVARFTGDSLLGDDFNGIDGLVKRCDPAGRGVRRIGVHGEYSYACWPGEEQESDAGTGREGRIATVPPARAPSRPLPARDERGGGRGNSFRRPWWYRRDAPVRD